MTAIQKQNYHQVGKRKTSIARVYLRSPIADTGVIVINSKPLDQYFARETAQKNIMKPLEVVKKVGQFDVTVNVQGGGTTGQAEAIRHGIARALVEFDAELRQPLKREGLLTRDDRKVERKKYGLAKARKRFQYSKR